MFSLQHFQAAVTGFAPSSELEGSPQASSRPDYCLGCIRVVTVQGASFAEVLQGLDARKHTM